MAKKKGSENRFPRLQLIEAPEDAGPAAAGMIELRADEATHLPYVIDDAGTTTPLGGAPTIDYGEDGDISTLDYDDTPAGGASTEVARADHVHGMPSAGGGSGTAVGCRVSRTATQSITSATDVSIDFTATDEKDTHAFHDPASNPDRVTIPTGQGGYYGITGWVTWANNTGGTFRLIRLYVGATMVDEVQCAFHANVGPSGNVATYIQLADADIVRIKVYQDTGGALNVTSARLALARIGD